MSSHTDALPAAADQATLTRDGRPGRYSRTACRRLLAAITTVGLAAGALSGCALPVDPAQPAGSVSVAPVEFGLGSRLFGLGETLGLSLGGVWLAPTAQHVQYGKPEGNGIGLWVFAPGVDGPFLGQFDLVAAPAVSGRPASYLYLASGEGPRLDGIRFEWAPGAWAYVFHMPGAGGEAVLGQLAGSLRSDVDEPARFGFTLDPPPVLALAWVQPMVTSEDGGSTRVWFAIGDEPLPMPLGDASSVLVSVGYWNDPLTANATVGGHQAFVVDEPALYSVSLLEVGGYTVEVTVSGERGRALFSAQQADALALTVQTIGSWTDRSQWTDDPIR